MLVKPSANSFKLVYEQYGPACALWENITKTLIHKDWQYTAKRGAMHYVKMEKKNARRKGKSSGHSDAKMLLS